MAASPSAPPRGLVWASDRPACSKQRGQMVAGTNRPSGVPHFLQCRVSATSGCIKEKLAKGYRISLVPNAVMPERLQFCRGSLAHHLHQVLDLIVDLVG